MSLRERLVPLPFTAPKLADTKAVSESTTRYEMKYAFSRFSTVSCFMDRAISSRMAFMTASPCARRNAMEAIMSRKVLANRMSLPSFEWSRQQRDALLGFGFFLNLDLGNEDPRRCRRNWNASRFGSTKA